ncbi:hypothetical protein ANCDUO_25534 [Ancylostoma duodenale]|uniref:Uncharacterized protein n=1 Tax=Ancylostoma duodenale TaxID=51022 RepID=A0A0C2F7G3_9BILA|nr:hypothetical protein ANCDUO_25534 [Ancylostoma duodenale]
MEIVAVVTCDLENRHLSFISQRKCFDWRTKFKEDSDFKLCFCMSRNWTLSQSIIIVFHVQESLFEKKIVNIRL